MITIGHRGAAGYEPENTIQSFSKAIELGVDMIEFDVQLCKSGEIVVIHDYSLDRTTNGAGMVAETTLSELKKLNAGKGQEIPTLKESLQTINRNARVNIELKGKSSSMQVSEIIKDFIENKNWHVDDFIISSFDHKELSTFYKLMPEIRLGILYKNIPDDFNEIASVLKAYSINANFNYLTKEIVKKIHSRGYKVYAYTVNNQEDKLKMKEIGLDGVFTDYP